jgi:HlyD family secretion protein
MDAMDQPISKETIQKNRFKKITKWVLGVGLLIVFIWIAVIQLKPTAKRLDIFIGTVEKGDIQQTLTASGTVVPSYEYTINAPVNTVIDKVMLSNGASVEKGSIIMELDPSYTRLEYEKLADEWALRKNSIAILSLQFEKELRDLESKNRIMSLQIKETDAQIKSQTRLKNVGGAALEDIEKVKLQYDIQLIEKEILENELRYKRSVHKVERSNLELELGIQQKRIAELQKKLKETTITSPKSGVITWVNEDLGKTVQTGEPLVRIADLSRFRVEAITSDRHSGWLKPGTSVLIRINQKDLNGTISHTLPTIENNSIKFHIQLEKPDHELLRPNQKVEVFIVTSEKSNTLKLKMGPSITGAAQQDVFVLKNGVAHKVSIKKGLSNPNYVEILEGLSEGEQVILSDTKKYDHLNQFKIQKP